MKVSELIKELEKCDPNFEVNISVDVSDEVDGNEGNRAFGYEFLESMIENHNDTVTLLFTGDLNF